MVHTTTLTTTLEREFNVPL